MGAAFAPIPAAWDDRAARLGEGPRRAARFRGMNEETNMDHLASIMGTLEAACDQLEQCESMFRDDAEFMAALGSAQAAIARYNAPGNEFALTAPAAAAVAA